MPEDPKHTALTRFAAADSAPGLDVILRTATDPPIIIATLLEALRPAAYDGSRIGELGFGGGWLLDEMRRAFPAARLHGLDMSAALTREAHQRHGRDVKLLVGDMERLPFAPATFDAAVTCWTLYFMRDISAALSEIRRTLKPGALFVAATNARDHMIEYTQLATDAVGTTLQRELPPDAGDRFVIENGVGLVRDAFGSVELREFHGTLTIRTVDDALALWHTYGDWSVTDDETPVVLEAFSRITTHRLAVDGKITIRRHGGVVVARVR